MRKKTLEKRMQRLLDKKAKLAKRCDASEDAAEVRSLTEQLEDVNAEIAETQEELDVIAEEERAAKLEAEKREANPVPAEAKLVNGSVVGSFKESRKAEDPTGTMEYRQAFMAYVQKGIPMPEMRSGDAISTADTGAAIPVTVMNEVINTVRKRYGNLYDKVRKMNVAGGVKISVGALQAKFK